MFYDFRKVSIVACLEYENGEANSYFFVNFLLFAKNFTWLFHYILSDIDPNLKLEDIFRIR